MKNFLQLVRRTAYGILGKVEPTFSVTVGAKKIGPVFIQSFIEDVEGQRFHALQIDSVASEPVNAMATSKIQHNKLTFILPVEQVTGDSVPSLSLDIEEKLTWDFVASDLMYIPERQRVKNIRSSNFRI